MAKIPITFSRIILLVNDPLRVTRAFTFQRPVLLEYVAKLHAVAEASRLLEGCVYTNVHGGLVALMAAEHLRGSCPRIVKACAVLHEFQQSTGYELGAKAVRCPIVMTTTLTSWPWCTLPLARMPMGSLMRR